MDKYKIIELLCTAQPENIELAEQLCLSQGWDILEIIKNFGYNKIGLDAPNDFLTTTINCSDRNLDKLPDLLPAKLQYLHCANNSLTCLPQLPAFLQNLHCDNNLLSHLPDLLPTKLLVLTCGRNQLHILPNLPPYLEILVCNYNPLKTLPDLKLKKLRQLYVKNIDCFHPNLLSEELQETAEGIWQRR